MNIVILGTAYPYRGGLSVYNERLAKEFIKEGHNVTIVTFTLQYPDFLFPGKTQYADWQAPDDLTIIRKLSSVNPLSWYKTAKYIKKLNTDLLIIKYWLPFMAPAFGSVAKLVKRNKKTKVISILDNIIPHEKRIGDNKFSKYFVSAVDAFVGMSDSVLNDLNIFTKEKPREFCPHPLYDNFGEKKTRGEALKYLDLSEEYRYILFFGLIRDYKGLDILLEAFADEKLKNEKIKLIIAGEFYSSSDKYLELIEKLNLKDRVVLHSQFVPDAEVTYFFSASDLVVQPYKTATQSGVTQIAYHFEKPMIVTNVGGLPEIVPDGECGYVVDVDSKKIADAIYDFFKNEKQSYFLSRIKQEKKKYEWSRMTQTIINLYNKLNDNKK